MHGALSSKLSETQRPNVKEIRIELPQGSMERFRKGPLLAQYGLSSHTKLYRFHLDLPEPGP